MLTRAILSQRTRLSIAALLLACALPTLGQQPAEPSREPEPEPPPPGSIYTLHVYTNLIQMPMLVLGPRDVPIAGITREQFKLSIDGGPTFHPTQMHMEGAETLMLAILLDVSRTEPELVAATPAALAALTTRALTTRDQIALFAFACEFAGLPKTVLVNAPAVTEATDEVLKSPGLYGTQGNKSDCLHNSRLRDSIALTIGGISGLQRRRVIIVITDGYDRKSKHSWAELRHFAVANSVAIFAIRSGSYFPAPYESRDRAESVMALHSLCEQSGGIMLEASPKDLPATLTRVVSLIRSRYIIEFPRPSNSTAGVHQIDVKVSARDVRTFATGASASLPQDAELNDPNTLKGDPTRAPVQGSRSVQKR